MSADPSEIWATAVLADMMGQGLLELSSRSSLPDLTLRLASLLAHESFTGDSVANLLIDHPGVAEFNCDDDELLALVKKHRPRAPRAAAPPPSSRSGRASDARGSLPVARRGASPDDAPGASISLGGLLLLDAILSLFPVQNLAKKRRGNPDLASQRCRERIALRLGDKPQPPLRPELQTRYHEVEASLGNPQKLLESIARAADGLEPSEEELFRLAFGALPVVASSVDEEDEDDDFDEEDDDFDEEDEDDEDEDEEDEDDEDD